MKKLALCVWLGLLASQSFAVCPPVKERSCKKHSLKSSCMHLLSLGPISMSAALGYRFSDRLPLPYVGQNKYTVAAVGAGLGAVIYATGYGLYTLFTGKSSDCANAKKPSEKKVHFEADKKHEEPAEAKTEAAAASKTADSSQVDPSVQKQAADQKQLQDDQKRAANEAQLHLALLEQIRFGVKLRHVEKTSSASAQENLHDQLMKEMADKRLARQKADSKTKGN